MSTYVYVYMYINNPFKICIYVKKLYYGGIRGNCKTKKIAMRSTLNAIP